MKLQHFPKKEITSKIQVLTILLSRCFTNFKSSTKYLWRPMKQSSKQNVSISFDGTEINDAKKCSNACNRQFNMQPETSDKTRIIFRKLHYLKSTRRDSIHLTVMLKHIGSISATFPVNTSNVPSAWKVGCIISLPEPSKAVE